MTLSLRIAGLALVQLAVGLAASNTALAEEDPVSALVGKWDVRGSDDLRSVEISSDHTVIHSFLGEGDIRHENGEFFIVSFRHRHLECPYRIRKYDVNEMAMVSVAPSNADCFLGEMRRLKPDNVEEKQAVPAGKRQEPDGIGAASAAAPPPAPDPATAPPPAPTQAAADAQGKSNDLKDCETCPELVKLPLGNFIMGSPKTEGGRRAVEGPERRIEITEKIAIGKFSVTRREFKVFVAATGYEPNPGCTAEINGAWQHLPAANFSAPPVFVQDDQHPVVCVNWADAKAYTRWLAKTTGQPYRLPTEAEREYAARAGTTSPFWWGSQPEPSVANFDVRPRDAASAKGADVKAAKKEVAKRGMSLSDGADEARATFQNALAVSPTNGTRPVSSFSPNAFGLYNMLGNVGEWTEDCWNAVYPAASAVAPGQHAITTGDCTKRAVRGGGWSYWPEDVRSAYREGVNSESRYSHIGFRVVRPVAD